MIVNWLWTLASGFVTWMMSLIPDWAVPDNVLHADDAFNGLTDSANGLGVFVPWLVLAACIGAPMALWAVMLLWRGARVGISHLPFIGGR